MSQRILVVDHHPRGLQRLVDPLRDAGYEVVVARTVADGASAFGRFEPALVFIAARLPRTHGTVLCRELKRTGAGARVPIVLVVESTDLKIDLPSLDQFGADRLIRKPVRSEELLALCAELIETEQEEEQAPVEDSDAENEDALNIALEELESLDLDLPKDAVRGAQAASPPAAVEAPPEEESEGSEEIEDRLDDLFTGEPAAPPAPAPPGPAHHPDADGPEDDLGDEIEKMLGTDRSRAPQPETLRALKKKASKPPAAERESAPPESKPTHPVAPEPAAAPHPAPPATSATTTVGEPVAESKNAKNRFQIEALTPKRTMPQPLSTTIDARSGVPLARRAWIAVPLIFIVAGLAIFFVYRGSEHRAPDASLSGSSPGGGGNETGSRTDTRAAGWEFGLPEDALDETDGDDPDTPDPSPPAEPATAEPEPLEPGPVAPAAEPPPVVESRQDSASPVVESRPEPAPPPAEPRQDSASPVVEPRPAPAPPPAEPRQDSASPVVEPRPAPAPAPAEPRQDSASPVVEPRPEPAPPATAPPAVDEPEPVTREPVLLERVEPSVAQKDLQQGGGTVVLRVRVNESGRVTRVVVEQGLPGSPLEVAAVSAVLRWRYEPALDRGEPVEAWATAEFTFGDSDASPGD